MEEKIFFKNKFGNTLCGILELNNKTNTCAILVQGFCAPANRERYIKLSHVVANNGCAFFRFDLTGYGESEQIPFSMKTHLADLESAIKEMKLRFKKIILVAESMGAHLVMRSNGLNVDEIIFWAPKTNTVPPKSINTPEQLAELNNRGKIVIQKRKEKYIIPKEYVDSIISITQKELTSNIKKPIYIIQGTKDYMYEDTKIIIPLLPKGTSFYEVKDATHAYPTEKEYYPFIEKITAEIISKA